MKRRRRSYPVGGTVFPATAARAICQAVAASVALVFSTSVHAQNRTWDSSGSNPTSPTDGSGFWDTSNANWSTGTHDAVWSNTSAAIAYFGSDNGSAGTVTIDTANINAGGLNFSAASNGNYTIATSSGSETLTLVGGAPTITIASGLAPTISAGIAGTSGVAVSGGGTLLLSGNNTFTGGLTVNSGALLQVGGAAGLGASSNLVTVQSGSATQISVSGLTIANNLNLAGNGTTAAEGALISRGTIGGTITVNGGARIGNGGFTDSFNGQITSSGAGNLEFYGFGTGTSTFKLENSSDNWAGGTTITSANSGNTVVQLGVSSAYTSNNTSLTLNATSSGLAELDMDGRSLTVAGLFSTGTASQDQVINSSSGSSNTLTTSLTGTATFGGVITGGSGEGTINVAKSGTGTQIFAGANTYNGTTSVSAGMLVVNGSLAAASAVSISGNATLGGSGAVGGTVSVSSSGILDGGDPTNNGAGTLTLANGVTLLGTASVNFQVGGISTSTNSISIHNSGGTNTLTLDGAAKSVTVNVTGVGLAMGNYDLIGYDRSSGTAVNSAFTLGSLQPRVTASLGFSAGEIQLDVTGADFPVWTGAENSSWVTGSSITTGEAQDNWVLNSNNSKTTDFVAGDTPLFNDLASSANTTVKISAGNVAPGLVTFNNNVNNYTISSSGGYGIATGSIVKSGTGSLTINTSNSYSGGTTLNAGMLNIGNASALGTGTVTLNGGAIDNTTAGPLTLSGNNPLALNGNVTFIGSNALNVGSGAVTMNNPTITVPNSSLTIGGVIGGTGSLTLAGSGTLILSGASTYTGNTTIKSGTLSIAGTGSIAGSNQILVGDSVADNSAILDATASGLNVSNGQTLAGHGTINGNVTTTANSQISPGGSINPIGTTTFNGNLNLIADSALDYDFTSSGGNAATSDEIVMTGGGTLSLPSTQAVDLVETPNSSLGLGTYVIADYSAGSLNVGQTIGNAIRLVGPVPNGDSATITTNAANNQIDLTIAPYQPALYQAISADTATIAGDSDVLDTGNDYLTVFKPVPQASWVKTPYIATTGGFNGTDALGLEIDPTTPVTDAVDKVDVRVSHADDASALDFSDTRYLGFAVKLPSATFQSPVSGRCQIAQWWQGGPYSPPLSITVDSVANGRAHYEVLAYNDTTGSNPSSTPLEIGSGEISLNTWDTFVVKTTMSYTGSGEVELWQNGNEMFDWSGAVGYNPSTIPYTGAPPGTSNPNSAFDVFVGPYRDYQEAEQQELFDQMRWANDYADAVPVPASPPLPVPLPTGITVDVSTDSDIGGNPGCPVSFTGGTLAVNGGSFTSQRSMIVGAGGGTIDVASGDAIGLGPVTWAGGTLNIIDSGAATIAQNSGNVSVTAGSALNISSNSIVTVGGTVDPFTDSTTPSNHVAIINNGALTIAANCTIAGITGAGALTIGAGGTSANTVVLATNSGLSTLNTLTILNGSTLDVNNNELIINYAPGQDPITTIQSYLASGYNGGNWNGPGIISTDAQTLTNGLSYALGFADYASEPVTGFVTGLSSGQIEVKYTLVGDLNLNGFVDGVDFSILGHNFNKFDTNWTDGNMLYHSLINGQDFSVFAKNFGRTAVGGSITLSAADWAAFDAFEANEGMAVPEPASVGLLGLGCIGLLISRRRRNGQNKIS